MKRWLAAMVVLTLAMSFFAAEALEGGVYDEALLINWTDDAFQEAFGVGAKGFVPSDPQPLTYIAACEPVIDPMTGRESEIGWSEMHRSEPVTAENVLQTAGDLSALSLTLTDDPNRATYYAVIQYKYDYFGKVSGTDVPMYKGRQTLTLKNMLTGESARTSRDIWFEYEIKTSVFEETVGKELYAGPTTWVQEDANAFIDLLGLGLDGLYDYRDDEGGGVCITKYLGQEKKSLALPDTLRGKPVTGVGSGAFSDAEFTSVTLPETLTHIDDYAFGECVRLASIHIPRSTGVVGDRVFAGCAALKEVTCAGSVESVGDYAFARCEKLSSVRFEGGVKAIGEYAFSGCEKLKKIDLYGLESLDDAAFFANFALESVILPETLVQIGEYPFGNPERDSKWESVPKNLVLSVIEGSYAHKWAQQEGIPFIATAPPTEEELMARRYPPLKTGSKGENVRLLQQKLIDLGYLQDSADGSYGPRTAAAVSAAQADLGMAADGVASALFQAKLYGEH